MPTEKLFDKIESVKIRNLTKRFGNNYAVKDLNLDVLGGELLILIGGSGSGKTTTLKMINRLITPDSGTITINNIDLRKYDEVTLRRNIGYVIQQIGLFPHLTVKENIGLIPKLEGWSSQKINDRVQYLLKLVELNPDIFLERFPKELSGGQQQRVGLARALAMNPRLLLMDEPFGALDPILRKQLQAEFKRIKKDIGRTIIFVTHDIEEAFELGDRIAIMHEGKLIQIGTPEELILHPKNELIANLVDANHKFRHVENIKIKELMIKIDKKYIFSPDMTAEESLHQMSQNDIEFSIIIKDSVLFGWVSMKDLINKKSKELIKDICRQPPIFQINDSAADALNKMKKLKQLVAVVVQKEKPVGVLIADEMLMKLI